MYMPCRSKGAHPSDLIYDTVLGDVDIHQRVVVLSETGGREGEDRKYMHRVQQRGAMGYRGGGGGEKEGKKRRKEGKAKTGIFPHPRRLQHLHQREQHNTAHASLRSMCSLCTSYIEAASQGIVAQFTSVNILSHPTPQTFHPTHFQGERAKEWGCTGLACLQDTSLCRPPPPPLRPSL
jgi:hypothetical protein